MFFAFFKPRSSANSVPSRFSNWTNFRTIWRTHLQKCLGNYSAFLLQISLLTRNVTIQCPYDWPSVTSLLDTLDNLESITWVRHLFSLLILLFTSVLVFSLNSMVTTAKRYWHEKTGGEAGPMNPTPKPLAIIQITLMLLRLKDLVQVTWHQIRRQGTQGFILVC